jgi:micrococcal nuclease
VRLASGNVERVRYIGIDTPEIAECYAERARSFNERLVARRAVKLVLDADERDRYGRLLAYVYADGTFVNAELVRRGYAQVLTVPPNVRYARRLQRLARAARSQGAGLWSTCES